MLRPLMPLILTLFFFACNEKDKNTEPTDSLLSEEIDTAEMTEAEKIADAYGYKNWDNVEEIAFAFNVARRDGNTYKRSWTWNPKSGDVKMVTSDDTVSYNRNSIDSTSMQADKSFVNDKYWLLTPFQLVWDEGTTFTGPVKTKAPIDSLMMNKLTITYGDSGGYTPGDAYDLYYGDDYKVRQWVYRRQNVDTASMATYWDNEQTLNGITLAKDYNNPKSGSKIFFTDIDIKMKDQKNPN